VAGCFEPDNEAVGSIKCGEFFDYPSDCQLLKKDPIPFWNTRQWVKFIKPVVLILICTC
jgi:hypothetical protein